MKTLRMIAVGLVVAAVVGITGCKVVNLQLDVDAGGIKIHAGVAEFSTTHELEIPEIKIPFVGEKDE